MEVIDRLIQGQPQSVENGAVLLCLSAWHIYPDMVVLQDSPVPVRQQDALVDPGGILTVGLQLNREGHDGIYWSLPLAHLRYYGSSVMSQQCLNTAKNRVSVDQLITVAVGCLMHSWHLSDTDLARMLTRIWEHVATDARAHAQGTLHWLGLLAQAVEPLLSDDSIEKKQCIQLLRLGRKRGLDFLSSRRAVPSMVGLCSLSVVLSLITSDEEKIEVIRSYVKDRQENFDTPMII